MAAIAFIVREAGKFEPIVKGVNAAAIIGMPQDATFAHIVGTKDEVKDALATISAACLELIDELSPIDIVRAGDIKIG